MDWSAIEPSILGTLFERGLDPKIRAPLGANYTDPGTIMKLVRPVVVEPLEREWEATKAKIGPLVEKRSRRRAGLPKGRTGGAGAVPGLPRAAEELQGPRSRVRLRQLPVFGPARAEGPRAPREPGRRSARPASPARTIETSPDNVRGIEINAYAAELARVTVWIGEIQWMLKHGYDCRRNPILARLDHIENRDALLNEDGSEAEWPART